MMGVTPVRVVSALAAVGIGGALGYVAGAAKNDPNNDMTSFAGGAGIASAIGGTFFALDGWRTGGVAIALGGAAMLAGAIIGEVRDGEKY